MRKIPAVLIMLLVLFACESLDRPDIEKPIVGDIAENSGSLPLKRFPGGGPFLEITVPFCTGLNPALVPPITTFEWQTIDGVNDPDSVRWILVGTNRFGGDWDETLDYIRDNPEAEEWYPWQAYDPSSNAGTRWTSPPLDFGAYVFAVHGRAADSTANQDFQLQRNAVRIFVSARSTGPLVTLTSDFMEPVVSSVPTTPVTVLDLPAGTPLEFCWSGDASGYCGVVRAYRYGWNIIDLNDDSQWDVDWTDSDGSETCSATRTFFFGTHTFHVEVIDNSGYLTRIPIRINITTPPVTLSLDIRPGACPNPLNPKSKGSLWVALLGSEDFDVRDVDMSTLALSEINLGAQSATPGQSRIEDVATVPQGGLECDCPPDVPDGLADLNLKFRMAAVSQAIGPATMGDVLRLVLAGLLNDGTPFMAVDCVRIVGLHLDEEPPVTSPGPDTEIFQVMNTYRVDNQMFIETVNIGDAVPDTVPFGSWITVHYNGSPGASDTSFCLDPVNKCITFQKNFTWSSSQVPGFGATTSWLPVPPEDNNPFGTVDSTSLNMGGVEYMVRVRSVDEFDVPDSTPPEVPIVGNFEPTLDDFGIQHHDGTLVGDGESIVWDWWSPANFHGNIADTLDLSDPPNIWVVREFFFLVKGSGHDHPKEGSNGGVKSWFYTFRRSDDPSFIQPFAQSGFWTDAATVNSVCDTARLTVRYSLLDDPGGRMAWETLPDWVHRSYDFRIRGRDTRSTDEFDQLIFLNGTRTLVNSYNIAALGRETEEGTMTFYLTIVR